MIDQIRPAQVADWLAAHQGTTVLDVREAWEVQTASPQPSGFTLVHMPMNSIPARLAELDPRQPIACLCHHGGRSMQVANFLGHHGFETLANIAGGMDAWAVELDPSIARY